MSHICIKCVIHMSPTLRVRSSVLERAMRTSGVSGDWMCCLVDSPRVGLMFSFCGLRLCVSFFDRKAAWECSVISGVSLSTVKDSKYALGQETPCTHSPLNQGERGENVPRIRKESSFAWLSVHFRGRSKNFTESRCLLSCRPMMTITQEPTELLTACRQCSNILMEEKVQLES